MHHPRTMHPRKIFPRAAPECAAAGVTSTTGRHRPALAMPYARTVETPAAILFITVALAAGIALGSWFARRRYRPPLAVAADHMGQLRAEDAGALLSSLSIGLLVLDAADRVVVRNPVAQQLGLVHAGTLGHEELLAASARVRAAGGRQEVSLELPGAGPRQPVSVLVRASRLTGGRILLLVEDRTAAQRIEAVRRDFLGNVSHELKTPVGAISLLGETIQQAADDPGAVRHFADRMALETHRLTELVRDIIELSRAQSGSHEDFSLASVADLVTEAVEQARTAATARSITISTAPAEPVSVRCEPQALVSAIRNLLDNAVTYSEPGSRVEVDVEVAAGMVAIAVVDHGIGIPTEAQARIFERFYRVDAARSRSTGGTGLGLSIVKHLAAEHGGEVTLHSHPGQGSTFTLRLPAAAPAAPGGAAP